MPQRRKMAMAPIRFIIESHLQKNGLLSYYKIRLEYLSEERIASGRHRCDNWHKPNRSRVSLSHRIAALIRHGTDGCHIRRLLVPVGPQQCRNRNSDRHGLAGATVATAFITWGGGRVGRRQT